MAEDVFLLKTNGLPLFAKCFGGKYCSLNPDHSLQSGFLAAIYAYSRESYGDELKSVIFNEIKLDFKIDKETEIILVFVNPTQANTELIENQLEQVLRLFKARYRKIGDIIIEDMYSDFEQDLIKNNIVTNPSMGDISKLIKKKSKWRNFLLKFKRK